MATAPTRLLVPTDYSACSRRALEMALALAERFGASIDLLHVWRTPHDLPPNLRVVGADDREHALSELLEQQAQSEMVEFVRAVAPETSTTVHRRFEAGEPSRVILDVAQEGYGLLVIGTHGRTGLQRFLMGSVTEKVVRLAPCPVLTVRGGDPA